MTNRQTKELLEEAIVALTRVKDFYPPALYRSNVKPTIDKLKDALSVMQLDAISNRSIDELDTVPDSLYSGLSAFGIFRDEEKK